jgi:ferritin-like metal-binding protein YciE
MDPSKQKVQQYLEEAHGSEMALIRVLQEQIAMTSRGSYRSALEKHLRETRDHAQRVQRRLGELGAHKNPVQAVNGVAQAVVGQALALAKTPVDILRGTGGEEKVLKNAKDACATEALEIATYTSIEQLARAVGDAETAALAASIRADEERMLELVLGEIPKLTAAVVGADVKGDGSYDLKRTGAADTARATRRRAARTTSGGASRKPRGSRGGSKPWPRYDDQTADEIVTRLAGMSESERSKVRTYERAHKARSTVLEASERSPASA